MDELTQLALARGWYCQDGFGPHPRWGSFCPCSPAAVGAMPDRNRAAHFLDSGVDDLYVGCLRMPVLEDLEYPRISIFSDWEKVMHPRSLEARYGLSPETAKVLATDIAQSFQEGMKDLEKLLREREEEIESLRANEPIPRKYT